MIHKMTLSQPYYDMVKNNMKTVEIRILDEKRKLLNIKDKIEFYNEDKSKKFIRIIKNLIIHDNFELAIRKATLRDTMPNCKTVNEANNIYLNIYKDKIKGNKILAIYLKS